MSEQGKYHIHVYQDSGYYIGQCVELPIIVKGNSDVEIINKIKLGIKEHLEVFPERHESPKIERILSITE